MIYIRKIKILYSEQKKKRSCGNSWSISLLQNSQITTFYSRTRRLTCRGIFQNSHLCIAWLDLIFNKISASSWKPEERSVRTKKSYDINRFYLYMIDKNQGKRKERSEEVRLPQWLNCSSGVKSLEHSFSRFYTLNSYSIPRVNTFLSTSNCLYISRL